MSGISSPPTAAHRGSSRFPWPDGSSRALPRTAGTELAIERRHGDFHGGPRRPALCSHRAVQLGDQALHDAAAEAGRRRIGIKTLAVVGEGEVIITAEIGRASC